MKLLKLIAVIGVLLSAILGILFVLNIFPDQEIQKTVGQMASIIGIISAAGILLSLLNKSSNNQGG